LTIFGACVLLIATVSSKPEHEGVGAAEGERVGLLVGTAEGEAEGVPVGLMAGAAVRGRNN